MDWERFYYGARVAALRYWPREAEDVVQDAALRAFRRGSEPQDAAAFGWVVAKHVALDRYRHYRRKHIEYEIDSDFEAPHDSSRAFWVLQRLPSDIVDWLLRYGESTETKTPTERVRASRLRQRCKALI